MKRWIFHFFISYTYSWPTLSISNHNWSKNSIFSYNTPESHSTYTLQCYQIIHSIYKIIPSISFTCNRLSIEHSAKCDSRLNLNYMINSLKIKSLPTDTFCQKLKSSSCSTKCSENIFRSPHWIFAQCEFTNQSQSITGSISIRDFGDHGPPLITILCLSNRSSIVNSHPVSDVAEPSVPWSSSSLLPPTVPLAIGVGIHIFLPLKLRHNRAKSIAGSPCGDRGLESCKNPAAIRRFGTHPGLIRRWSGKFNSQLKFAGWSADSSPLFLIRRRPVGHRPIIERRSGGHRPKCSGKNLQVIERRSGNRRPMTARCHQGYRTEIRRCL